MEHQKGRKRFIFIMLCIVAYHHNLAQINLVPNPSFEDTVHCPYFSNQLNFAIHWYTPTPGSSDYCNACSTINQVGVPFNVEGFQFARTGNAYAGFATYYAGANEREYLQVKLDSVLIANHKYCTEFYVSLCDTQYVACNNMGLYFSDTALLSNSTGVLNVIPQINNDIITNPLTNKIEWTKVSGVFVATGGENYITIGNFLNDANSDTVHVAGGCCAAAGYYLDDVSVIDCTYDGIAELKDLNEVDIFPNPATNEIRITSKKLRIKKMKINNVLGGCVYERDVENEKKEISVDVSGLVNGMYFVEVMCENKIYNAKFIKQ